MSVTLLPSRSIVTESGLIGQPLRELRPGEAGWRRQLEVAIRQVGGHALLVFVKRVRARRVRVPERHGLRNPLRREAGRVRFARLPRTVRRFVMHHQKERLLARPALDELEGQIGDDIGGVAARVRLLSCRRVEHRIPVCALAREDLPAIEPGGIAAEMPLADHAGVVPALLQQPRDCHPRAVEPIEHGHAVQVRVLAGQNRGAARRADRVRGKHVREQRALAGQPIDVRRLVDARPVGADGVRRVVVGHDEDDVGPGRWPLHRPLDGHAGGTQQKSCERGGDADGDRALHLPLMLLIRRCISSTVFLWSGLAARFFSSFGSPASS